MSTINWDGFRYFYAAAKSESLSAAAKVLGSNQSTVGRHIDNLECALGRKLFHRSVKGLKLTDDGFAVFEQTKEIHHSVRQINHIIEGKEAIASGTVRLSLPEGLGQEVLIPLLDDFYQQYPDVKLVFNMSATTANLTQGNADIAVRLFKPENDDLQAIHLGDMRTGLYASAAFKEQYGLPNKIKDLKKYKVITYGDHLSILPENQWLLNHSDESLRVLRSDSTVTRFKATTAGIGISLQPEILANTTVNLSRLFKAIKLPSHPIWLVYASSLHKVPRIRVVAEFISSRISPLLN